MGSGGWFKTIISPKKVKHDSSKQKGSSTSGKSNGFKWKNRHRKDSVSFTNGSSSGNHKVLDVPVEDLAATRIQAAFRAYMARRILRRLKGTVRLQILTQKHSVKKQAATTVDYLHSWSQVQAQIRARRLCMVTEGRLRQKKLENKLKLEGKLHDLEAEWCGGSEKMEEILARIHQREEAAVKRERAMAYAFSHQWRANSSQYPGLVTYEPGKENWGWSWKERWIAARPWEIRVPVQSISAKTMQSKKANNKAGKTKDSPTAKATGSSKPSPVSSKQSLSKVKGTAPARRLSYPGAEKRSTLEGSNKAESANAKKEELAV